MALSTDVPTQGELRPIRAVLFDFAETLFAPETPRQKIDSAVLDLGHEPLGASETDRLVALIDDAFASPDYVALRDRQDLSAKEHRAAITFALARSPSLIA